MSPGLRETILGRSRLVIFMLGPEALDQSDQRPPVVRMAQKVRVIDRFRFGRAIGQQEHRPKMVPHGQRPKRRLRVWERLFYFDRILEQSDRVIIDSAGGAQRVLLPGPAQQS